MCWEAETVWENIGDSDDVDNPTIGEVDDPHGGVDWDSISEHYTDWIYEYKQEDFRRYGCDFAIQHEDDEDYNVNL